MALGKVAPGSAHHSLLLGGCAMLVQWLGASHAREQVDGAFEGAPPGVQVAWACMPRTSLLTAAAEVAEGLLVPGCAPARSGGSLCARESVRQPTTASVTAPRKAASVCLLPANVWFSRLCLGGQPRTSTLTPTHIFPPPSASCVQHSAAKGQP